MFNHELLKKNYESGIKTHQALVYTQKKVCKLQDEVSEIKEQNRLQALASTRQELLLQAILSHVTGGINDPFASNGVNDAATALANATPTQFDHTHDAHDDGTDDSNTVPDAMELDMTGELQLGTSKERTTGGVETVSIVSLAAAASSTKKTTSNQGKNKEHSGKKRSAGAGGDGIAPPAKKKKRDAFAVMVRSEAIASCPSGLEKYPKMTIKNLVSEVIHKRLPVTAVGERNPLKLDKMASQVRLKLRRTLNFISDNCETEDEYRWWSSRIPPQPTNASQEQIAERKAKAVAIGTALEKRCLEWVNGEGKSLNKEGKYQGDVPRKDFDTGKLQSRIDSACQVVKDQWIESATASINSKKRTAAA